MQYRPISSPPPSHGAAVRCRYTSFGWSTSATAMAAYIVHRLQRCAVKQRTRLYTIHWLQQRSVLPCAVQRVVVKADLIMEHCSSTCTTTTADCIVGPSWDNRLCRTRFCVQSLMHTLGYNGCTFLNVHQSAVDVGTLQQLESSMSPDVRPSRMLISVQPRYEYSTRMGV